MIEEMEAKIKLKASEKSIATSEKEEIKDTK